MTAARPASPAGASSKAPLGILAGGGSLPTEIATACLASGRGVHIVALSGEADPAVAAFPHTFVNWGQIGGMLATLRRHHCAEVVFAGTVRRPDLRALRPDLGFWLALPRVVAMTRGGDNSVLRRVVRYFEHHGFKVVGLAEAAPHLLAAAGPLGTAMLDDGARPALARGLALLEALGPFDVGQAVVATGDRIVAIEGADGTDAMLDQLAERRERGGVLIKWPKPGQELRLDLPAVGPRTIERAARAGLVGIVVQARGAVLLEREALRRAADAAGIFVAGVARPAQAAPPTAGAPLSGAEGESLLQATLHTRRAPSLGERSDITTARRLAERLAAHGAGHGVVVARGYVLAVAAGETPEGFLARAARLRQWGGSRWRRSVGVAMLSGGLPAELSERLHSLVQQAHVSGLVLRAPALSEPQLADLVRRFDEARLFLLIEEPAT